MQSPQQSPQVIDVTPENFQAQVVERSKQAPEKKELEKSEKKESEKKEPEKKVKK